MNHPFDFALETCDPACAARVTRIRTLHGEVETPVFMPVGTQATVKAVSQEELAGLGAQIILSNAYHLYLRPGVDVMREAGGIHQFMSWDRPVLTDSGGFQVFSLGKLNKVTADGVEFQSHLDGSRHFFTPEKATDVQIAIGADLIMCFDECTDYPVEHTVAAESMRRTVDWAMRCKARWGEQDAPRQALFGIVQGSVYQDLRRESADRLVEIGFPGYAIGGVSVGESKEEMMSALAWAVTHLPKNAPRYVMGVGTPEDLLECVQRGIDMFDCVMPTRNARNGSLFTSEGRINIKNRRFQRDFGPLDAACACPVCKKYSRAYLSHLYRSGEVLALRLNTLHNLFFMLELAANARNAIRAGHFVAFKKTFLDKYGA